MESRQIRRGSQLTSQLLGYARQRPYQVKPEAKVLILSGFDCSGKMPEILKRGCDGCIQKPYSLSELSNKLRETLNLN